MKKTFVKNPSLSLLTLAVILTACLPWAMAAAEPQNPSDQQTVPQAPQANTPAVRTPTDSFFNAGAQDWDPLGEMEKLRHNMDKIFNQSLDRLNKMRTPSGFFEPSTDLQDLGDRYVLKADLPGVAKDKINLEVTDSTVTISGEREDESTKVSEDGYTHTERNFGSFKRSVTLPEEILSDKVSARHENGVLEVTLPKKIQTPQAAKARAVAIQ